MRAVDVENSIVSIKSKFDSPSVRSTHSVWLLECVCVCIYSDELKRRPFYRMPLFQCAQSICSFASISYVTRNQLLINYNYYYYHLFLLCFIDGESIKIRYDANSNRKFTVFFASAMITRASGDSSKNTEYNAVSCITFNVYKRMKFTRNLLVD